jgi:hypothetical protein
MFKVIVERPRWGSRFAAPVKLKKDHTDQSHIGLKRHAWHRARIVKSLNENLRPLVRFLRSRVGRPWDEVFSEICAGLDTGSTVKMHVRQHLEDFVAVRISQGRHGEWLLDGLPLDRGGHRFYPRDFYVDPEDGVLKDGATFWRLRGRTIDSRKAIRRAARMPVRCDALRWIDELRLVLRRERGWFLFRLDRRPQIGDFELRDLLLASAWREGSGWSVVEHRQLSKREMKKWAPLWRYGV